MTRLVKKPIHAVPAFKRTPTSKKFKVKSAFKSITLILTGISLIYLIFFSRVFQIKKIEVFGAKQISESEIKDLASKPINSGRFLAKNIIFYDTNGLQKSLKRQYFSARGISVKRKLFNTITIDIQERVPKVLLKTAEKYFVVGNDGVVSEEVSDPDMSLLKLTDLENLQATVGDRYITSTLVSFMEKINEGLKSLGLETETFLLPETTFELRVQLKNSYKVYFDSGSSAQDQLDKFKLVYKHMKDNGIVVKEYINLTIPNRVYYK